MQVRAIAWNKARGRQRLDVVSSTSSHGHIACLLIAQCFLVFLRPSGVFTASVEKACIRMCIFHICLCKHHVCASSVARPVLITNIFLALREKSNLFAYIAILGTASWAMDSLPEHALWLHRFLQQVLVLILFCCTGVNAFFDENYPWIANEQRH